MILGDVRRNVLYPLMVPTMVGLHTENPSRTGVDYELTVDGNYARQPIECEIINNEIVTQADVDIPVTGGSLVKYISYWDEDGYIGTEPVALSSFGSSGTFRILAGTTIVL